MRRWRWLLLGLLAAATAACGLLFWATVLAAPSALLPPDASEVRVRQNSLAHYQVVYRAAGPLTVWRLPTIDRLTSAGWVRGRRPDSPTFDRSLWFVRRRTVAGFGVVEYVSIQAEDGPTPMVLLNYQRSFLAPSLDLASFGR
jgi:hypothetical protein